MRNIKKKYAGRAGRLGPPVAQYRANHIPGRSVVLMIGDWAAAVPTQTNSRQLGHENKTKLKHHVAIHISRTICVYGIRARAPATAGARNASSSSSSDGRTVAAAIVDPESERLDDVVVAVTGRVAGPRCWSIRYGHGAVRDRTGDRRARTCSPRHGTRAARRDKRRSSECRWRCADTLKYRKTVGGQGTGTTLELETRSADDDVQAGRQAGRQTGRRAVS